MTGGEREQRFTVEKSDAGKRLDAYLAEALPDQSRSYIRKLIGDGRVKKAVRDSSGADVLSEKPLKASAKVTDGDTFLVELPEPENLAVEPEEMPLEIVYEDEDLLIVNKPKGLSVHPGAGHPDHTLVNGLLAHCGDSLSGINGVLRPGIVHRIDKDTSGLLIVCKNDLSHRAIAEQLAVHSIRRIYYGITTGTPPEEEGTVDKPVGRHPVDRKKMAAGVANGKRAVTHYRVKERFRGYALCEFQLETGRTHQIRVHMASIGHPLLGDTVYGAKKPPFKADGQALHAAVIGFTHPRTGKYLEFYAPLPKYFEDLLTILRKIQ